MTRQRRRLAALLRRTARPQHIAPAASGDWENDIFRPFLLAEREYMIIFDNWNNLYGDPGKGERRAWREFRERHPDLRFEDFAQTSMQKGFIFLGDGGKEVE